jgi:hypothetical protein
MNTLDNNKVEIGYYSNNTHKFLKNYINLNGDWLKNGQWTGYFNNGNLKYKENYILGNLNGDCLYYKYNGSLSYTLKYNNGLYVDTILGDLKPFGNLEPFGDLESINKIQNTSFDFDNNFNDNDNSDYYNLSDEIAEYIETEKIFDSLEENKFLGPSGTPSPIKNIKDI